MARFMPKWVQSLFSVDPAAMNAFSGFLVISYQHPFQLAILFAVPIAAATALLAGDVEQRTMGLILSRPVSRFTVVLAASIVCLAWPALAVMCSVGGTISGMRWTQLPDPVNLRVLGMVALNLYLLAAALTSITLAISAMHDERGDSIGWAVTISLLMYVWNFLAQLWATSGSIPNFSLFRYYSPASILLRGATPTHDLIILGSVAAAALVFSAIVFRLRDITV
ncbi:MAG: ABC transporter permease subunit [Candidatus Sumerlaeaceae bacterium]